MFFFKNTFSPYKFFIFMQLFACFSFYYYCSRASEIGLGKIKETTNQFQLSVALAEVSMSKLWQCSCLCRHMDKLNPHRQVYFDNY